MPLKFVCCVSIFCVFCLFGRTQLPTVAAAPFEYNEEHEQYPYDLETEQSKAKYDTRLLLSQQLQPEQKSSSDESIDSTEDQKSERGWHHKYNNEEKAEQHVNDNDDDDDDLQPHERAASCYTREHKYTHGQKVPRIDPCEVCLCMDGEIFCWWEKCEKRKSQIMKLNKQPEILHQKKKILRVVQTLRRPTSGGIHEKATSSNIGKYKTQQPNNNNKKPKSKLHKKQLFQQNTKPQKQQLQQQQQYHKHSKKHLTTHEEKPQQKQQDLHMSKKDFSSTQNSRRPFISKIMSFPENLPSVLYYDYHTEEHEHHKHQHHQQHLKHQMQKKLQKLQREHNWLQQTSKGLINDDNDDDDDGDDDVSSLLTTSTTVTPEIQAHHDDNSMNRILISSPSMRAYDDLQTDSDILPEPPTKKPKFVFAKLSNRTATMAEPRGSNLTDNDSAAHVMSTEWTSRSTAGSPHRIFVGETSATSSIFVTDDVIEINKNSNENSPKTSTHRTFSAMDIQVNNRSNNNKEAQDDAFHRWLTSTETNNDRKNNNNNNNNNKSIYNNKIYNDSLYDENLLHYFNENSYATESSEFENPFGIQNLSISIQQNVRSSTGDNKNSNKNIQDNENNRSNKLLHPKDQGRVKNAKNRLFPGAFNNDASDYNGSVVNIDISLTTQDEIQQQEQQQQHWEIPKHEETEQQLPETPTSTTFAADLILNQSDTKQTAKTINDTKMNATKMGGLTPQGDGNSNNNNNNNTETYLTKSVTTSAMTATASPSTLKTTEMSHVQLVKHTSKDDNEADAVAETTTATSTTIPERHCNVMGTLYKIGEVLPQDTGNCLQCICIDGSTIDDTPRVTCSPHNCPPLVLPDLFDATGY